MKKNISLHMPRKITKLSMLTLIAIISAAFISGCGGDGSSKQEFKAGETDAETKSGLDAPEKQADQNFRGNAEDNLPGNLDFGKRDIRIMHYEEDIWGYEIDVEEETGDIVKDAIYRRNRNVEERLNVNIKSMPYPGLYTNPLDFFAQVKKLAKADSDDIDLVAGYAFLTADLGTEGYYINWHDVDYVDFSRAWWSSDLMDQMTVDGKLYCIAGDIGVTMLTTMYMVFFNKQIAADYEIGSLYKTVLDGDWTIDKMNELCKGLYVDLNGNGEADKDDLYGCSITTGNMVDAFYSAFDFRIIQIDKSGMPQLTMNTPKMADIVNKLYDFLYVGKGVFALEESQDADESMKSMFTENRALFLPQVLLMNDSLRAMDTDYGMIPYPKWDKQQETYHTSVVLSLSLFSIPITCQNPNMVGAVAEALCAESYRRVTPAYFEIALKQKYSRDDETSQMLDIIRDGLTFDFGYMNSYSVAAYHFVLRNLMSAKSTDFASVYEKSEKTYQNALDKLVESYKNNP